MEEEDLTQKSTQPVMDPRRFGRQHSGLSDEDLTDILCILHPASLPACIAAALIHSTTPAFTVNAGATAPLTGDEILDSEAPGTFELAEQGVTSCDLALRLSAPQKNPLGGFQFGRHAQKCDFVLSADDPRRRVSNVHFRIYINEQGVIMFEDCSTNGTVLDGVLLKGKDHESGVASHTINNGCIISFIPAVTTEEPMKFIVRIPQRDPFYEDLFNDNVQAYFQRLRDGQRLRDMQNGNNQGNPKTRRGEAPDIFAKELPTQKATQTNTDILRNKRYQTWKGGEKYNRLDVIGKGAFATVYMLTTKFDGTKYAAKELDKRRFVKNGVLDQKVESEIKIMSKIRHPHIVQYIEYVDYHDYMYLILDYVPGGDLGTLVNADCHLTEGGMKVLALQLLSALEYLHMNGITHRDIKPDNILIQSTEPFHVKLTDFGLSKMVEDDETFLKTFCGTLLYCAPEVYTEYREYDHLGKRSNRGARDLPPQQYGNAVDVWSLGAVFHYAVTGRPPYPAKHGTTHQELLNTIMTTTLNLEPMSQAKVSTECQMLVLSMLNRNPLTRTTVGELLEDEWLQPSIPNSGVEDNADGGLDEVDMVGDAQIVDETLEQSASQLSIRDDHAAQSEEFSDDGDNDDDDDDADLDVHTQVHLRKIDQQIPSSFPTDDGFSSNGSSAFLHNSADRSRFFGEVDPSALGSSGFIPRGQLNLALSKFDDSSYHNHNNNKSMYSDAPSDDASMVIDNDETYRNLAQHQAAQENAQFTREIHSDVSLFGAESMVGNLKMDSLSPSTTGASSPEPSVLLMPPPPRPDRQTMDTLGRPILTTRPLSAGDLGRSALDTQTQLSAAASMSGRRRSREYSEERDILRASKRQDMHPDSDNVFLSSQYISRYQGDQAIPSTETPSVLPKKASRRIQLDMCHKLFWDPADKSTWKKEIPFNITTEEWEEMSTVARSQGDKFYPNAPSFNHIVRDVREIRASRSASVDSQSANQAGPGSSQSPSDMTVKRDGQQTEEFTQPAFTFAETQAGYSHDSMNTAAIPSNEMVTEPAEPHESGIQALVSAGNDSKDQLEKCSNPVQSQTILAKMTLTKDSEMPPLVLDITNPVTVWGRGAETTLRYWHVLYERCPKYSFKLALWKPDMSTDDYSDASFYISTKSSNGIRVNQLRLPAHQAGRPDTPSMHWAELRNGDRITIFVDAPEAPRIYNCFIFEAFVGISKQTRPTGDFAANLDSTSKSMASTANNEVKVLPQGEFQEKLDKWVLAEQKKLKAERRAKMQADPEFEDKEEALFFSAERNAIRRHEQTLIPESRWAGK